MKRISAVSNPEYDISLSIVENTISYPNNYKEKGFKDGYTYEEEGFLDENILESSTSSICYWSSSIVGDNGFVLSFKYGFCYGVLDSTCNCNAVRCVRSVQ